MSVLTLVRHGQASFGADDYDVLSARGAEQSRALGSFWREHDPPTHVFVGPRRRHQDTDKHLREAHGGDVPSAQVLEELDEFPVFKLASVVRARHPEVAKQVEASMGAGKSPAALVDALARRWISGDIEDDDLETYPAFRTRVRHALRAVTSVPRGSRVLVVSSAGPLAVALMSCLSAPDDAFINLAAASYNTSFSEYRFRSADDLGLLSFNRTPHLGNAALLTHR